VDMIGSGYNKEISPRLAGLIPDGRFPVPSKNPFMTPTLIAEGLPWMRPEDIQELKEMLKDHWKCLGGPLPS